MESVQVQLLWEHRHQLQLFFQLPHSSILEQCNLLRLHCDRNTPFLPTGQWYCLVWLYPSWMSGVDKKELWRIYKHHSWYEKEKHSLTCFLSGYSDSITGWTSTSIVDCSHSNVVPTVFLQSSYGDIRNIIGRATALVGVGTAKWAVSLPMYKDTSHYWATRNTMSDIDGCGISSCTMNNWSCEWNCVKYKTILIGIYIPYLLFTQANRCCLYW